METAERRAGIFLDVELLDHQLSLRGLNRRDFCRVAGIPEPTLSRAAHGRAVTSYTLRKLAAALLETPVLAGADLLVAAPTRAALP